MPITDFPTRSPGSFGATKSNRYPVGVPNQQHDSAEYNELADRVIQLFNEVGLTDGSTPGSLRAAIMSISGNIYSSFVVGNEPEGDAESSCDFLDPGDGTGVEAAIAASYGEKAEIKVRRGFYDRAELPDPIIVPSYVRVIGEGIGLTVFEAPTGAGGFTPWRVFEVESGELTDMSVRISETAPDADPPTKPVAAVTFTNVRGKVRRVLVECYGAHPAFDGGCPAGFGFEGFLGGQVMEDCAADARFMTLDGDQSAVFPLFFVGISSGTFGGSGTVSALEANMGRPIISRFHMFGGPNADPVMPGTGVASCGVALGKLADVLIQDSEFHGCLFPIFGLWLGPPSGTIVVGGPKIRRCKVVAPNGLSPTYQPCGPFFYPQAPGGPTSFYMRGMEISDLEVWGPDSGGVQPGLMVLGGLSAFEGLRIRGVDVYQRADNTGGVFNVQGPMPNAVIEDIRMMNASDVVTPGWNYFQVTGDIPRGLFSNIMADIVGFGSGIENSQIQNVLYTQSFDDDGEDNSTSNITVG